MVGILDSTGTAVVNYTYDAWGSPLPTTGTMKYTLGQLNPLRYRGYVYDQETWRYYLQSRYYNPYIGRFLNADAFAATGQGLLGNNMFAYCGNNPVANIDSTGLLFEKNVGGGGLAYAGSFGGHIVRPTTPSNVALSIPFIPPSTTYGIDSLRSEIIAIKNKTKEETRIATITTQGKKPVLFPENPLDFKPFGLVATSRDGSYNGKFISWMMPFTKVEVFRWDENITKFNGSHYHIFGAGHFYPGDIVPEPWATFYFWYLQ